MADQLDRLQAALAGQYDVERPLGEGGMAVVYLARDAKHGRQVAIKVLKPDLSATIGAERFTREVRVAAQLQHPGILGLYDSGTADGLFYYVMPFVEGEALRARLDREQQLPIEDALRIAAESAEALHYAHEHGIIHRDIKPENILLNGGHALVADFGIAKAVEEAGEKLTQTGMAIGTPHYMSPEQSMGGPLDGRSDQYSLGCVLYELLAGQPPFDGKSAMQIIARHSLEQVPSLQVVRGSVPDAVEDLVMRALEKTPADRFPTMAAFAAALREAEEEVMLQRTQARRAVAAGQLPPAQGSPPVRRSTTRLARPTDLAAAAADPAPAWRRWAIGAGALVAVGAAVFAGMKLTGKGGGAGAPVSAADDARHVAVLYFDAGADSLRYLADGLTEGLISSLAQVPELDVISRNGVAPFRGKNTPRDSIRAALQVGTFVTGDVGQDGNRVRGTIRLIDAVSGAEIERASFEQPAGAYLMLRDSLAEQAATFLRKRLGGEVRLRAQRSTTASTDAWVLLQRAEAARKAFEAASSAGDSAGVARQLVLADSLAQAASKADGQWNAPVVFRGFLQYRQSRLAIDRPTEAQRRIDEGIALAETALGRDAADPDALELRGSLRYWRWLMRLAQGAEAQQLLGSAKDDFLASTRLRPTQAGAWSQLSHLYYQTNSVTDVMVAAQRAYEADAYLENAPAVINRLFLAAYDLEQEVDALRWCNEGARRLPEDARFVMCRLYLMTMRGQNADPTAAWSLADRPAVRNDATTGSPEFRQREARMLVAAVLARAGLKDSAMRVGQSALAGSDVDPTKSLYDLWAFAQVLAGDKAGALTALKTYLAANPDRRRDFLPDPGWRYRPLLDFPGFKDAVATKK